MHAPVREVGFCCVEKLPRYVQTGEGCAHQGSEQLFSPPGSGLYSGLLQCCGPSGLLFYIEGEVVAWPNRRMSFSELTINENWNGFG